MLESISFIVPKIIQEDKISKFAQSKISSKLLVSGATLDAGLKSTFNNFVSRYKESSESNPLSPMPLARSAAALKDKTTEKSLGEWTS
jgi:hypothetical protein